MDVCEIHGMHMGVFKKKSTPSIFLFVGESKVLDSHAKCANRIAKLPNMGHLWKVSLFCVIPQVRRT